MKFLILFLMPINLWANIRVAILDTGFCPEKIKTQVRIEKVIDLTNSVDQSYCQKFNTHSPRFHGHLVLENFLLNLKERKEVNISPFIIFNNKGEQTKVAWQKALNLKFDLIISAAEFINSDFKSNELYGNWFVAAPRVGPQVKRETILFPASLAPKKNLFLIGDYVEGEKITYDEGLLYQDKINFYFPSGKSVGLKGTSYAVAIAAAKALEICPLEIKNDLSKCLIEKSFQIEKIKTY